VFVPGVWDQLHRGHLNLLWEARGIGDVLIVSAVSDDGCRQYKNVFPAQHLYVRMEALRRLRFVDVVVAQQTTDPSPLLERFLPDVLVHGDDWDRLREGQETMEMLGVDFVRFPYTPGISSTNLRAQHAEERV
jgi:cytidyltransferase-like protein